MDNANAKEILTLLADYAESVHEILIGFSQRIESLERKADALDPLGPEVNKRLRAASRPQQLLEAIRQTIKRLPD